MKRTLLPLLLALAVATTARAETLSLDEALRLADTNALSLVQARLDGQKAGYDYRAALGDFGPKLQTSLQYQRWDKELRFTLDLPPEVAALAGDLGDSVIRKQHTYTWGVTVLQPLTPLWTVWHAARIADLNLDGTNLAEVVEQRRVRLAVHETWFGVLGAAREAAVLAKMEQTVEGHRKRTADFVEAGLLQRADLLRVEVQLEQVRQGRALAETGSDIGREQLALLLGRPVGPDVALIEPPVPEPTTWSIEAAAEEALANRHELQRAELAVRMARLGRSLRLIDFAPSVSALFNYSRATASSFGAPDQWFVGLNAEWTLWEWGKSYHGLRANGVDVLKAETAVKQLTEAVRLEVRAAWLGARTSHGNIARTERAVQQAREALRLQLARFEQRLAPTTDVLDAESVVLQAEKDHAGAIYGYALARARLLDAMGKTP